MQLMHFSTISELISAIFQWIWIFMAAVSPIALNVWAWRLLRHGATDNLDASRKRHAAQLGVAANLVGYALPIAALVRNVYLMSSGGRMVSAGELGDFRLVQEIMVVVLILSISMAALGPKRTRIQLMVSAVIPFVFWMSIPIGIL
jgi:hypothetical protein